MKKRLLVGIAFPYSVVLAMMLTMCGGGGGGSEVDRGPLTGLSINGPTSMTEYANAAYTATASWTDGSTTVVTPTWSVSSPAMTIDSGGRLSCAGIDSDTSVMVTATYSSGEITKTATTVVSIVNLNPIPFTAQMLSGQVFYQEDSPGETSDSNLFFFNADSTFTQIWRDGGSGSSGRRTGTWSVDASGILIESISGQGTSTIFLISDSSTEMKVLVDDGGGNPTMEILEKTLPVDASKIPGNYLAQNGETWEFRANGTGFTSGAGGWNFMWSVESGILKSVFSNGYVGWLHARAGSQSTDTAYTVLKVGFAEYAPGGVLYQFVGGKVLTRQ